MLHLSNSSRSSGDMSARERAWRSPGPRSTWDRHRTSRRDASIRVGGERWDFAGRFCGKRPSQQRRRGKTLPIRPQFEGCGGIGWGRRFQRRPLRDGTPQSRRFLVFGNLKPGSRVPSSISALDWGWESVDRRGGRPLHSRLREGSANCGERRSRAWRDRFAFYLGISGGERPSRMG